MMNAKKIGSWEIELGQVLGLFHSGWARLALVLGALIHVLGFVIFEVATSPSIQVQIPEAYVRFPPKDSFKMTEVFAEQALLYDSEPLFLPTPWNASPKRVYGILTIDVSSPFKSFAESRLIESVTPDTYHDVVLPAEALSAPEDVLALDNPQLFAGFGHITPPRVLLPAVEFSVAAYDLSSGALVYDAYHVNSLGEFLPHGELWAVCELLIMLDAAGMVGEPLVVQSTGKPKLDWALKQFCGRVLGRHFKKTGYFKIYIGP